MDDVAPSSTVAAASLKTGAMLPHALLLPTTGAGSRLRLLSESCLGSCHI